MFVEQRHLFSVSLGTPGPPRCPFSFFLPLPDLLHPNNSRLILPPPGSNTEEPRSKTVWRLSPLIPVFPPPWLLSPHFCCVLFANRLPPVPAACSAPHDQRCSLTAAVVVRLALSCDRRICRRSLPSTRFFAVVSGFSPPSTF